MLDWSGQDQRELEQMLSINEGHSVTFLLLQTGTPLRGFNEVRTITTINTKIPHSVPTGALELNIFIGHSLKDFTSLQRSYWEEKSSVPLWLQEPSDLPEVSQCQQHYLVTRFFWDLKRDSILLHQHTLLLLSFQSSNTVQSTALRNLSTSWV